MTDKTKKFIKPVKKCGKGSIHVIIPKRILTGLDIEDGDEAEFTIKKQ